jgi:hypothetical protein
MRSGNSQGGFADYSRLRSLVTHAHSRKRHNIARQTASLNITGVETFIFWVGYFDAQPVAARIRFVHHADLTDYETIIETSDLKDMMRYGSDVCWDLLRRDSRFAVFNIPPLRQVNTLLAATMRARNEIKSQCSDLALSIDPDKCWAIGEPIHIAEVTPEGFTWIDAP